MNESIRALALFLVGAVSLLMFGVGLIAALTPSEGMPSVIEVVIFLGVPLVLSGGALYFARKTSERVLISVVFVLILAVATMLFSLVYSTMQD